MIKKTFDLNEFNRLDQRPDPLLPENPCEEDLKKAFPFLFKPNRALALHPRGRNEEFDPDWPAQNNKDRWLIRIKPTRDLELPLCISTLSQSGSFALWRFKPASAHDPAADDSGLYPLYLLDREKTEADDTSALCNRFSLYSDENSDEKNLRQFFRNKFDLLRIVQNTDEDGWHSLRMETRQFVYLVELDLTAVSRQEPVPYFHTTRKQGKKIADNDEYRQIGGWDTGDSFHWQDNANTLLQGSPRLKQAVDFTDLPSRFRLKAAVNHDGMIVAGGQHPMLYVLDREGCPLQKIVMGGKIYGIIQR
ncbi:MAG: hypothetical protein GY862_30000 [Gammaproteobacteria bacterium]|nr:hypothetical protein [Gammaproteobacteria bacterium]